MESSTARRVLRTKRMAIAARILGKGFAKSMGSKAGARLALRQAGRVACVAMAFAALCLADVCPLAFPGVVDDGLRGAWAGLMPESLGEAPAATYSIQAESCAEKGEGYALVGAGLAVCRRVGNSWRVVVKSGNSHMDAAFLAGEPWIPREGLTVGGGGESSMGMRCAAKGSARGCAAGRWDDYVEFRPSKGASFVLDPKPTVVEALRLAAGDMPVDGSDAAYRTWRSSRHEGEGWARAMAGQAWIALGGLGFLVCGAVVLLFVAALSVLTLGPLCLGLASMFEWARAALASGTAKAAGFENPEQFKSELERQVMVEFEREEIERACSLAQADPGQSAVPRL